MACPYHCDYCINAFESDQHRNWPMMPGADWIRGLSRLTNLDRPDGLVPVTLQGGEPSVHPDFYEIINGLPKQIRIDILTNLCFDVGEMIRRVDPHRLRREAPYASIRVSYHPDQVDLEELLAKTHRLLEADFHVGIWAVGHPDWADHIGAVQERARREGIDFRIKEFLGTAHGKLYGTYKYPDACSLQTTRQVLCRTTELILGPDGSVYRCHHDLYEQFEPVGHILDPDFRMKGEFLPCDCYGHCNPCDIKIKTNRLQQFGHTS
ncbi:MAG: hypothetical protein AMJ79_01675, partial [Phycisphaerae bacterium SM23_30]